MSGELVLGIETSCDETAASVVANGREVLSSVVSSQIDLHASFGGVVPEIAGRAHLDQIMPVIEQALLRAGVDPMASTQAAPEAKLSAIAATVGPGLVGSLLVGIAAAKSLALAWGIPFVGVNHLEGHLHAVFLEQGEVELPLAVLLVSGGHTLIVGMDTPGRYTIIGETVDDAAGEAFDKVARFLELGYPGGPQIERVAKSGDPKAIAFPRPMSSGGFQMSFSGLKTAVIEYVRHHPEVETADVAASFQHTIVEVLVDKTVAAAVAIGAKGICLAGGVAANGPLRERLSQVGNAAGFAVHLPERAMCTDNAAMIAAAGYFRLGADGPSPFSLGAEPSLRLVPR